MKAAQLHHASIRVADVARSQAFYEGLLGLQVLDRPDVGVPGRWYGIGAGQLHLIQSPGMGSGIDPSGRTSRSRWPISMPCAASWPRRRWRRSIQAAISSGSATRMGTPSS